MDALTLKKIIRTTSIILLLLFGLAACSESPEPPTSDEVLRDAEALASNTLLGETTGIDGNFPLAPLIIEEMDVSWVEEKESLNAEITAFFGDKNWKSEVKQTIIVHYELNASRQWEAQGGNVNTPVIRVIPRE